MKKIAVFASGNGSNFESIVSSCLSGEIDASVVLLVCDNPSAFVLQRAERLGINAFLITYEQCGSKKHYEEIILDRLISLDVDLICLAGYMKLVGKTIYDVYHDRILNIHPSLLPEYKGAHAIDDAFNAGETVYGVTVHFIDLAVDNGMIVMQRSIVYDGCDRNELETMIHSVEHLLYPEAINFVLNKSVN